MEKLTKKYCPHCGTLFNCNASNINDCFCSHILISKSSLQLIKANYTDCLCANCIASFSIKNTKASKIIVIIVFFMMMVQSHYGQFHGPVGSSNTTALHKDSSAFKSWASTCVVTRGWQDISNTTLGYTDVGSDENGTGKAGENPVVSFGDGGSAILTFSNLIVNGPGPDFAVFENSFSDAFLELAFVEVSSDGVNYFRFPATSNTPFATQIGAYDELGDATKINNLAGKYRVFYGTPFDLEELSNVNGLNINAISHVKIIDVVGSILSPYASLDMNNNPINDPFPTGFNNGGFDLDAVGVINKQPTGIKENEYENSFCMYPNPCTDQLFIINTNPFNLVEYAITNANGAVILHSNSQKHLTKINTTTLSDGIYFLCIQSKENKLYKKFIIHR
jgi:hypothetical protein